MTNTRSVCCCRAKKKEYAARRGSPHGKHSWLLLMRHEKFKDVVQDEIHSFTNGAVKVPAQAPLTPVVL